MTTISFAEKQPYVENRPWYDNLSGIKEHLADLDKLTQLINARYEAGYNRKEKLNEFYLFGRYWLDTVGNCAKGGGKTIKDVFPDIPNVITVDELTLFRRNRGIDQSFSYAFNGGQIPTNNLKCGYCQKGWGIENCHDVVVFESTFYFQTALLVGKTMADVYDSLKQRDDAKYFLDISQIYNKTYIITADQANSPSEQNLLGCLDNPSGYNYSLVAGDRVRVMVYKYFHSACNRQKMRIDAEERFRKIFIDAGFEDVRMTALQNEYCACEYCAPWFRVATEFGGFVVGWRKRVINIDWSQSQRALSKIGQFPEVPILALFESEEVTKGAEHIHAWGYEKAQEYLAKIAVHLSMGRQGR